LVERIESAVVAPSARWRDWRERPLRVVIGVQPATELNVAPPLLERGADAVDPHLDGWWDERRCGPTRCPGCFTIFCCGGLVPTCWVQVAPPSVERNKPSSEVSPCVVDGVERAGGRRRDRESPIRRARSRGRQSAGEPGARWCAVGGQPTPLPGRVDPLDGTGCAPGGSVHAAGVDRIDREIDGARDIGRTGPWSGLPASWERRRPRSELRRTGCPWRRRTRCRGARDR